MFKQKFYRETILEGEELIPCLRYTGLSAKELKRSTIECFTSSGFMKYWVVAHKSDELNPDFDQDDLYTHFFVVSTLEDQVVAAIDGYAINSDKLEAFYNLKSSEDEKLSEKARLLEKELASKQISNRECFIGNSVYVSDIIPDDTQKLFFLRLRSILSNYTLLDTTVYTGIDSVLNDLQDTEIIHTESGYEFAVKIVKDQKAN